MTVIEWTISPGELDTLRALDRACYEDSEMAGDGWAEILEVSDERRVGYECTAGFLRMLWHRGLAERQRLRRLLYAPTEKGAEVVQHYDRDDRA